MDDERFQVHGTVTGEDGRELMSAEVVVWQQRLRERRRLAEGRTDEEGRYRISYRPPDDAPGKLLIVVTVRSSRLRTLLESPVTQAQPDLRLDLEAQPRDRSQHATLLRAISPLLERLALVDIVESEEYRDISFLAQDTGYSREEITRLVVAARLEAAFEIPAAAFYAFLRQQVPAALPSPLLEATQGFTLIDPLVHRIGSLIFALTPEVQTHTLQAAVQQGLIGTRYEQRIPELVEQLQARRTADALSQPYLLGKGTLAQLLDAAELPREKQPLFARALVTNTQSMRKFWRTLGDGQHGFTEAEASAVQRSLELGAFVKNHLPLVGRLLQGFREGTYATLADLARLSVQDWTRLVQEVGAPPNVDGAGPAGPAEVFAKVVYTRVTRAYPTAALAARVATAEFVPPVVREPVLRFFANNPALELGKTSITTYLEQAGEEAFAGIDVQHRPAVIDTTRRFQRVLRVIADVDAAQTLLGLGVHSATQIATMGRQQFFTKATQAGLTKREANRIYESGEQRYASVVSLITQLNRGFIGTWPAAVGSTSDLDEPTANAIQRDQSLATLFGSVDYCAATDCTSVLSPAAYLCDLLLWLRNHPLTGPFPNALAALLDRRPDLGHLLLNCPNTEVPVPYIDLVTELLEDAVSPPVIPVWKQTTRTAAELRAAPEYVNGAAYATVAAASYPHTLPYDTVLDELRTYLQQSGVALWQLRQGLLPLHNPTLAQRLTVAAERFQIDPHETDLIATPDFVTPAVAWNTADPANDLVPVPAFLRAATITYEQLLELLEVVWVRGGAAPLTLQGLDDTCDLSKQTLAPAPLDTAVLDRIHRILRLWRHTGWKLWELDLLLRAPATGNGVLDDSALVSLSVFRFLQDATGLAVDQQLAFFQDLDVRDHREPDGSTATSLYTRLFLDPSVPADSDLAALLTGGAVADPNLAHHLAAVQGALQVSAAEAATLFALTDGTLTLANLSLLYRVTALARAARLSLADLLRVTPLTSAASLAASLADPAAALAFVEQVRAIRQSGFSVDALLYVLTTEPTATGITDDQITNTVLAPVRAAIQQTHDEIFNSADPPLTVLQHELAQLPDLADPAVLVTAIAIVDDSYADTLANRNAFIAANFSEFMDVPTAQAELGPLPGALTPPQLQAAIDQRAQDVLAPLAVYLTKTRVIAAVAAGVQLPPNVTALLVRQLLVPATTLTLLDVLTDPALIAEPGGSYLPINPANFPNHYLAVRLLDKAGTVARRLHLVKADLSWLLANAAAYGGLDIGQLPVTNVQPVLAVAPLLTTSLLVKLDRAFAAAPPSAAVQDVYSLISAVAGGAIATEADAHTALAAITGWAADDVTSLASALGLAFPADYSQPATYDALRRLQAMAEATGGSGAQLISWGAAAPDEGAAISAQAVLKSRYAESDWLQIAPTMTDPIRERRSAALQAYLLAQRTGGDLVYGDANALFDHFLIDVQMSACEVTTRVVQAYAAVQLFVERCLMGLEEPDVAVDLTQDDTWTQWQWMKRYRLWEAARKVFHYPENWLVESQRPNRTELFTKLEQEVHQNDSTADYLETVVLNYIDRLDELAHLVVTGTCTDPRTGAIHVVARTPADPPRFYIRSFVDNAWRGWEPIQLDIKAHQVVPAFYRGRLCLFWPDIKVAPEPRQPLPAAQASSTPPSQETAKYVSIGLDFSIFRNGSWTPAQKSKGKLFDIPLLTSETVSDSKSVEALYTLKVQTPAPAPGYGASLWIDVFRLGDYELVRLPVGPGNPFPYLDHPTSAVHVGRAIFDGRFSDLELRNLNIVVEHTAQQLLTHAQAAYGPDAQPLLPLTAPDPDLTGEPGLVPLAGALATAPTTNPSPLPLVFTSIGALEQNVGPLLNTAAAPFRVVGPDADLAFDPTSYFFFFQDARRCYFVQSTRFYQWGSAWLPVPPSNAGSAPFEVRYAFHRFYHPYTRLFWHQLAGGGFPALYDRNLQLNPDTIDPSGADVFSFSNTYQPVTPRVSWGEDNEIVAFEADAAFSVYNWELFFHVPLYVAERLSQNQQFEDALKWFQFIFNPTRQGPEPVPQRFWIPKPLAALTSAQILDERINNLLLLVNQGDPDAIAQVRRWRNDPFNPFLLADQRPVAYMKRAVMSYLDNLIAWADNLFSSDSREALNEATLLYVIAAEILGPQPVSVTPPQHVDASFDDLEPKLDAFANALVEIENVVTGGTGGGSGGGGNGSLPAPQTLYFKIPPNEKLLGYWTTVADRLFKLRHCQNIQGVTRELALFDAPIDPGLLVKAQAAGVDLGSVLSDTRAPLPSYRFTALYAQALDFCAAVRSYGAQLLAAVEKRDAEALATQQKQLQEDLDQILQWRIDEAQKQIDALTQAHALAQAKYDDAHDHPWANKAEETSLTIKGTLIAAKLGVAIGYAISGGLHAIPDFLLGVVGMGGSPAAEAKTGGKQAGDAAKNSAKAGEVLADALDTAGDLTKTVGEFIERADDNAEKAKEAQFEMQRIDAEIAAANLRSWIAVQEQANHQAQADRLQQEIDFLTDKFSSHDLYDWMLGQLADTYFQSYRLAYKLCKQVERCYRYELGLTTSAFIQFGYWDSLKKGLLAGEALSHDLRRMQASYLERNSRRLELNRYLSLAALDPNALLTLLERGACDFDLPESLFDGDYPGHYQRRLVRVSVTVVYPDLGRFDNVKGTLTLTKNSVRILTDLGSGYGRQPGSDPRFVDQFGAVPQKIVLGNAQDDPGLFLTALDDNLGDPRYLPFEGAGAISSWHLELPAETNEIDLSAVGDVVLHLHYTALDGGDAFKQAVEAYNAENAPSSGAILLSAANDFPAPRGGNGTQAPRSPWQSFLAPPPATGDQTLVLNVSPSRFPRWARGKTITLTGLTIFATSWNTGNFVLEPQAPLPTANVPLTPVAGVSEPNVVSGNVAVANASPGTWTFKLRTAAATDFRSLSADDIGDVLLLVSFQVS